MTLKRIFTKFLHQCNKINVVLFPKLNYRSQISILVLFVISLIVNLIFLLPIVEEIEENHIPYFPYIIVAIIVAYILWLRKEHSTDDLYRKSTW